VRSHANPARAPLLLPHRLAAALGRDPLRPSAGPLTTAWADGLPSRRRALVGCGRWPLARWMGAPDPHGFGCRYTRPCPADAGCPSCGPSEPRYFEQRSSQPRGLLPEVPHEPRPARASAATLAHVVPAEGAGRPIRRSLRVIALALTVPDEATGQQPLPARPRAGGAALRRLCRRVCLALLNQRLSIWPSFS